MQPRLPVRSSNSLDQYHSSDFPSSDDDDLIELSQRIRSPVPSTQLSAQLVSGSTASNTGLEMQKTNYSRGSFDTSLLSTAVSARASTSSRMELSGQTSTSSIGMPILSTAVSAMASASSRPELPGQVPIRDWWIPLTRESGHVKTVLDDINERVIQQRQKELEEQEEQRRLRWQKENDELSRVVREVLAPGVSAPGRRHGAEQIFTMAGRRDAPSSSAVNEIYAVIQKMVESQDRFAQKMTEVQVQGMQQLTQKIVETQAQTQNVQQFAQKMVEAQIQTIQQLAQQQGQLAINQDKLASEIQSLAQQQNRKRRTSRRGRSEATEENTSDNSSETEPEVVPARSILRRTAPEELSGKSRSTSRTRTVIIHEPNEGRKSRPHSPDQASAVDSPRKRKCSESQRSSGGRPVPSTVSRQLCTADRQQGQPIGSRHPDVAASAASRTMMMVDNDPVNVQPAGIVQSSDTVVNSGGPGRIQSIAPGQAVPRFTGGADADFDVFLAQFELFAGGYRWNNLDKLMNLKMCLHGTASAFITRYAYVTDYNEFVRVLREFFGKGARSGTNEVRLLQRIRQKNETIPELRLAIEQLAEWAYPVEKQLKTPMFIRMERDAFIRALGDKRLIERVQLMCPQTIDEAARWAHEYEEQEARANWAPNLLSPAQPPDTVRTAMPAESCQQQQQQQKQQKSATSSDIDKLTAAVTSMVSVINTRLDELQGKSAAANSQPSVAATSTNRSLSRAARKASSACNHCQQMGHYKYECPRLSVEEKQALMEQHAQIRRRRYGGTSAGPPAAPVQSSNNVGHTEPKGHTVPYTVGTLTGEQSVLYYTVVYIGGQDFRVMLDLGAGVSLIGVRYVPPGMFIDRHRADVSVNAGNDTPFRIEGVILLKFRLSPDEEEISHYMAVTPDLDDILFGNDLLRKLKFACSLEDNSLSLMGKPRVMHPIPVGPCVRRIYTATDVIVEQRHEVDVPVNVPLNHLRDKAPALFSEACEIGPGVVAANVVLPGYTAEAKLKVLNLSNRPFMIPSGCLLTSAYPYVSQAVLARMEQQIESDEERCCQRMADVKASGVGSGFPQLSVKAIVQRSTDDTTACQLPDLPHSMSSGLQLLQTDWHDSTPQAGKCHVHGGDAQITCPRLDAELLRSCDENCVPMEARAVYTPAPVQPPGRSVSHVQAERVMCIAQFQTQCHSPFRFAEDGCPVSDCVVHNYTRRSLPFSPLDCTTRNVVRSVCCLKDCSACSVLDKPVVCQPEVCRTVYTSARSELCSDTDSDDEVIGPCLGQSFADKVVLDPDSDGSSSSCCDRPARARLKGQFEHLLPLLDSLPSDLSNAQVDKIVDLLIVNSDVFSKHKHDLGCTDLIEARIPTGNAMPHAESLRSHPRAYLDLIDKEIDEMLKAGVIQRCQSSWNANIVCVKKKNGDVRICVDLRGLNLAHKPYVDKYPLSRIDDCINALSGRKWFSSIDVSASFHQVPIHPDDKHKTAFSSRRGQFCYNTLTMGFASSPAIYCRLTERVLCGLLYDIVVAYVDDAVVVANDFEEMLQNLQVVLDRFKGAKLKLRPSKCFLFQHQIEFCGHIVSEQGRRVSDRRTACLNDLKFPTNIHALRRLIGFFSYNRAYIDHFSDLIEPLVAMTRKGAIIEPKPEAVRSFELLKDAVRSAPVLALMKDTGDFVLQTDASLYALGAALYQWQEGELRPLGFASRSLSKHERNYCTTRREVLGVIFGLRSFKNLITGHHVTVECDHAAIIHYQSTPEPMSQVARHLDELSSFDMDIVYVQGEKNVVADFLSRMPPCNRGPEGEPCKQCTRRMIGHGQKREEFVYAVSTTQGQVQTRGRVRTRSGRVSVAPPQDPAFDYSDGQSKR